MQRLRRLAAPKVDEKDIEYTINEARMSNITGEVYEATTVGIKYHNDYAGELIFAIYPEEEKLYIENIEVWDVYQNLGLAQYLYKRFGELYKEKYNGWVVEREFQHPAAEKAFKNAIELGWVPAEAFSEEHTRRTY